MKNFKRSLLILLVLCIASSFFVGCGKNDAESNVKVDFSTADINFVDESGNAKYCIVRPDATNDFSNQISELIKTFRKSFDTPISQITDKETKEGFNEIIIGSTSREISKMAKQALANETTFRKDDFIICSIDNNIAIFGLTIEATIKGIEYFTNNYITGEVVTGGIKYVNKTTGDFKDINICGTTVLSKFNIVRPIYNVSYITQNETQEMINYISDTFGYVIPLTDDNVASTGGNMTDGSGTLTPTTPNEYEIIIGNCVREGVKAITDYDTYEIRVEDKKIFLNGGSAHATMMAVSEFIKLLKAGKEITSKSSVLNGDYNAVIDSYDKATYYRPTWGDDFDGTDINYDIWNVAWDRISSYSGAANGKNQYRSSSKYKNHYVKDGLMYQVAVEDDTAYYGGWMDTEHIMNYRYGYIELSTIHPKGMGFWTSLWNVSHKEEYPEFNDYLYNSEVDVDECYGPGTWAYGNTFAIPTAESLPLLGINSWTEGMVHVNNRVSCKDDRGFYMDFHTFGFEWNGNTNVKFTCDGYAYVDQDLKDGPEQATFEIPQVVQLSLACGSGNHGEPTTDPEEWSKYNKFIVDWVKLYQKKGQRLYNYDAASESWVIVSE